MGCGEFLVKYILFFANLFFALAGLTLFGLGLAVQLKLGFVDALAAQGVPVAPVASMVVGGGVFLVAFFGCYGAIVESNCMLIMYSIFMIVLMAVNVALASLIFVNLDGLVQQVPQQLNSLFADNQPAFAEVQTTFSCCGTSGPLAYGLLATLPDSCCAAPPCTQFNSHGGCNDTIQSFVETFGWVIGGVAIVVGAIELLAVVFGLCLANHVRNKNRRARY